MATVLKPNDPSASAAVSRSGLAEFNLDDLSLQAQQLLQQCQEEITRLRAEAAAEADAVRRQAHAEGLQAGRQEAAREYESRLKAAVEARIDQHTSAVEAAMAQIASQHEQWLQQYADSLVSLVIAAAERVVRSRLDREPEIILRWAGEALAAARSAQQLTLAVHPETLGQLGPALDELLNQPGLPEQMTLIPDESVPNEGVVVRQLGGEVAATLQGQLGRLQEMLENA